MRVQSFAVAVLILAIAACSNGAATTTTTSPNTGPSATTAPPATTVAPSSTQTPATTEAPATSPATTLAPSTTTAAGIAIVIEAGVVDGPGRLEVALGDPVAFTVVSDVADEVHVHGYDLFADLAPGEPAVFEFTADIPGIFEVELEDSHLPILELVVQ